jgi:hypothetical protein
MNRLVEFFFGAGIRKEVRAELEQRDDRHELDTTMRQSRGSLTLQDGAYTTKKMRDEEDRINDAFFGVNS